MQVSDILAHIVAKRAINGELTPDQKLFLIDFLPNLQDIMDYDACIEVLLGAGLEEWIFASCGEDEQRDRLLEKHDLTDKYQNNDEECHKC